MTSAPNFNAVSLPEPHSCTAALAFQFFAKSCGRLHVSVSFKWGFNFQWIVKSNLQHSVESPRSVHTRNSYITYEPRLYAMRRDCMERERERESARARGAQSRLAAAARRILIDRLQSVRARRRPPLSSTRTWRRTADSRTDDQRWRSATAAPSERAPSPSLSVPKPINDSSEHMYIVKFRALSPNHAHRNVRRTKNAVGVYLRVCYTCFCTLIFSTGLVAWD